MLNGILFKDLLHIKFIMIDKNSITGSIENGQRTFPSRHLILWQVLAFTKN